MKPWEWGPRLPDDPGRHIPVATRRLILARDGNTCRYCGDPASDIDHVWPFRLKGTHDPTNLVACCSTCNSIAGSLPFPEFVRKRAYILYRRIQIALVTRAGDAE